MCFNTLYTLRMGLYEKDNYGSAGCVTNNCANNQSVFKSESLDDLKEFGRYSLCLNRSDTKAFTATNLYLYLGSTICVIGSLCRYGTEDFSFTFHPFFFGICRA